jgi:hypothetical protein
MSPDPLLFGDDECDGVVALDEGVFEAVAVDGAGDVAEGAVFLAEDVGEAFDAGYSVPGGGFEAQAACEEASEAEEREVMIRLHLLAAVEEEIEG